MSDNNIDEESKKKQEKELKKQLKNQRSLARIKKAFGVLFVLYIVIFIVMYRIKNDEEFNPSIYSKVGANTNGYTLSIKDALIIKEYTINRYKDYLERGLVQEAYNMLSSDYKKYMTFDEYKSSVVGINYSTIDMKSIRSRSKYAYEAEVTYEKNGEVVETVFMLYPNEFNETIYTISPDKFLICYRNQEFAMDGINLIVDECIVFVDSIELRGKITNNDWFEEIELTRIAASYDGKLNKWFNYNNKLAKGETKEIDIKFENLNYFVPNMIVLQRNKKNIERTYQFRFYENGKK